MKLNTKANTSLFKGDANFLNFRPSQLKPFNHLIKKKWEIIETEIKKKKPVCFC